MDKNRMEGVEHGSKITMKEMMGKAATDDKRKGTVVPLWKTTGKVKKGKTGQATDDMLDVARMDDDLDHGT
ncbi:hypothetical protein [Dyella sp.]|uniref:hypothetical protein n=1 Tax=Dyella sp. TaxID=1869338 RepID=UPI002D789708|nr:hypothetical protein [Dyella sp.]HET7329730.1 hypothetical protein [Dyella sp.]